MHMTWIRDHSLSFDIAGDQELFRRICRDMIDHAQDLAPNMHWGLFTLSGTDQAKKYNLENGVSDDDIHDVFQGYYSDLPKMLDAWIGSVGKRSASETVQRHFFNRLSEIDTDSIARPYFRNLNNFQNNSKNMVLCTDFGAIYDLIILNTVHSIRENRNLKILEVGGGYGRLAESVIFYSQWDLNYFVVDAVPASIMYSYIYLKNRFPDKKIGSYYTDDVERSDEFDAFIVPPWHVSKCVNDQDLDIFVNIQSMQEMNAQSVNYYYNLADTKTKIGGHIYFENTRGYIYKDDWPSKDNWKLLRCRLSPRAWLPDTPTELYEQTDGDHRVWNQSQWLAYREEIRRQFSPQEIAANQIRYSDGAWLHSSPPK